MDYFPWKEEYSVGIPEMDSQHRNLVAIINRRYSDLIDKKAEGSLAEVFDELIGYAEAHFKAEESLMETYEYPRLAEHAALHGDFREKVLEYKSRLGGSDRVTSLQVAYFLKDWLSGHILREDKDYGLHVLNKRAGGSHGN